MQLKLLKNNYVKGFLLILLIILAFWLLSLKIDFAKITDIEYLINAVESFGVLAPIFYILIMALAIIISPIPSLPLAAAAGMIWGPYLATLYSVIGAEIGAIISFYIARTFGRSTIKKLLKKDVTFCNQCHDMTLAWIIFVTRLFPFFQFDIISYGAGLTNIKVRHFAIATFFGMIPMTFLFAYFGKNIFAGSVLTLAVSIILIALIFLVPLLIKKYNLFGLRDKIESIIK